MFNLKLREKSLRRFRATHQLSDSGSSSSQKEIRIAAKAEIEEESHLFWFDVKCYSTIGACFLLAGSYAYTKLPENLPEKIHDWINSLPSATSLEYVGITDKITTKESDQALSQDEKNIIKSCEQAQQFKNQTGTLKDLFDENTMRCIKAGTTSTAHKSLIYLMIQMAIY